MKTFNQRLEHALAKYDKPQDLHELDYLIFRTMDNHKKAIWKLQKRIGERIDYMLKANERVFFLTFTFNDKSLPNKETEYITQDYIKKFFNDHLGVSMYVANTDYGKQNGRFHWHAVVMSKTLFDFKLWPYGAVNYKEIHKSSIPLRLSRYLIKLKRHAVKVQDPFMLFWPYHFKRKVL